jgi:glucosyl-3-phosphoglycerate synthase
MADFHQEGIITNLHGLYDTFDRAEYLANLERKLESYAQRLRMSLLLPCLLAEIHTPNVLKRIVDEIRRVRYLHSIAVALGGASGKEQFEEARECFGRLRTATREVRVIWVDGPRIQGLLRDMERREIQTGAQGKGQSVWIALGYLLSRSQVDVIALHDCDILGYDRILLGRLMEPTANPYNDLEFCKGYYPRISRAERAMKGRVTRLFVGPFLDALAQIMHRGKFDEIERFFQYHRSFKYPLAGEFSFLTRLARGMNIACDWGLEVSTLSEVYHRVSPRKIAQIDLANNYEHKQQTLSPDDADNGLQRMVVDISKFYLNYMRSHGVPLDDPFVDMIQHTYYQSALGFIKRYSDDAEVNDLRFDRHEEEIIARYFRDFLWNAWEQSKAQPGGTLIPSWNRVLYSAPEIGSRLVDAVEADNQAHAETG